jgi:hypothetical protein
MNFAGQRHPELRIELKTNYENVIEQLTNQPQIASIEHEIRFSTPHEKHGKVIAETYRHLVEASSAAEDFSSLMASSFFWISRCDRNCVSLKVLDEHSQKLFAALDLYDSGPLRCTRQLNRRAGRQCQALPIFRQIAGDHQCHPGETIPAIVGHRKSVHGILSAKKE